jgi:ubiquinone/menaquinone biosynthesis C-methylase UbiE
MFDLGKGSTVSGMSDVLDKRGLLPDLQGAALELGCGSHKHDSAAIGVDILDTAAADIVGDAGAVLDRVADGSVSRITSSHFFEHVDDVNGLLERCHRVLVSDGEMRVTVPHFSNPYYYSDLTHRIPYGLYSFAYLADSQLFERQVPTYQRNPLFSLLDVWMTFRTDTPAFEQRNRFQRRVERWVNSSRRRQEFYEERLSQLIPCYEVTFTLRRRPLRP